MRFSQLGKEEIDDPERRVVSFFREMCGIAAPNLVLKDDGDGVLFYEKGVGC
jgi:hypothetical protein